MTDRYGVEARERYVSEAPKRSDRTPFERDRARILHSSTLRRLSAKTQVLGPGVDDFVRNRLTHSLEVAQVARELGKALGCDPDIVDSAALAHDLGHPPFGHNGEAALDRAAAGIGGFEGNAQTLRLLTRLEAKTFAPDGRSVGLNLTRATLGACVKYPWRRDEAPDGGRKFGVYADDEPIFSWIRTGAKESRRPVEAQVMDLSDDIAYSVHDVEDGVVAGRFDLFSGLDLPGVFEVARDWYDPEIDDERLAAALERLRRMTEWPDLPFDGGRRARGGLKSLTSALIGRFAVAAQWETTRRWGEGPMVRYEADVELPQDTSDEILVLKAIAARHVMLGADRDATLSEQRALVSALTEFLSATGEKHLDPDFAEDFRAAADDAARLRVVVDQVASLTDLSAMAWADRLLP